MNLTSIARHQSRIWDKVSGDNMKLRVYNSVLLHGLLVAAMATVACSPDAPTLTVPSTPPITTPPPATPNAAPTVSAAFSGPARACRARCVASQRHGRFPARLRCKASASDPDRPDALAYVSSGCHQHQRSFPSLQLACYREAPGPVPPTYGVRRSPRRHGHTARERRSTICATVRSCSSQPGRLPG